MNRRVGIYGLGVGVFALMLGSAHAAPSKKELEQMEKRVEAQSLEHKKLQAQAIQINLELTEVSQEMVRVAKKIQNSEESLSKMEAELEKLREGLKKAEENFSEEDENLIKTLAALQNLALKPTESLFVQPLSPVEIIRSAMLLREAVPFLEENANRLRVELEAIENKKNRVEKQVERITAQKANLEKEHARMKNLVQRKSRIRNDVEIKSAKTRKEVEKLASQAQDLRDLLDKLDAERRAQEKKREEERRRLAAIEEEKRREAEKVGDTSSSNLIKSKPAIINEIGTGFAKARGSLLMPARGRIATGFNEQTAKGVKSKGISIQTREMAQVISPFDGSVIFAGPFRGYGNLIIIEHDGGYLSLLAGLESIDCELGQMLLAGEPVGLMPSDKNAKLYVEIRKDNQPIDPSGWFAVN